MDPFLTKTCRIGPGLSHQLRCWGKWLVPALRPVEGRSGIKRTQPHLAYVQTGYPHHGGPDVHCRCDGGGAGAQRPAIGAGDLTSVFVLLLSLVFGFIGFLDDHAKIKKKENTGLTASQKFLLQLAAAILFIVLLRNQGILSPNLYVPFFGVEWKLPWVVYMIFAALVITGTVNAVNITDGIDGLSSSVTLPVCAFFACSFSYAYTLGTGGPAPVWQCLLRLFFGGVGFLIYNFYPAKVFMGDTGSLFLGGAVCGMAFALDMPLILILVGIIYIVETLSDIIQIVYFKATHGQADLPHGPLHHHLEMGAGVRKRWYSSSPAFRW